MPELTEFLGHFKPRFAFPVRCSVLERYLTGLLTECTTKNCQTMAAVVPGTNSQQLNNLLTEMHWDEEDLNRQRVQFMSRLPTPGDGVLAVDDTGFPKKGEHSVGVAKQYSGTLGKVDNCQVAVNCHYAEATVAWPVNTRLYLPREWAGNAQRRKKAHVPEEISFMTKPEIGLMLLDQALAWGVPHSAVVSDAGYGDNPQFLDGLEERHLLYVVGVHKSFSVTPSQGKEEPVGAEAFLSGLPRSRWKSIIWREGSKGKLRARFAAVRLWRVNGEGRHHFGWLIGQKPGRGQTKIEAKYFWSNFGPETPLKKMVEYVHRLHWIEQYHEEAKGELGWDQFQGRRWDGWHRNAVTVMLSDSFLVWLEWRERRKRVKKGRPRAAFSPSTGSAATLNSERASRHSRLAQGERHSRPYAQRPSRTIPATFTMTK
jgi:SRSO17 transposase